MLEPKLFLQDVDRNCVDKIGFCQTLIVPLSVVTPPCCDPGKNRPQRGKGRGDKALILIYLDSPTAEVFQHQFLFFSILAIFRAKRAVKVGPKMLSFGPSLFHKNSNPSKNFQTNFLFARVLTLVRIAAILDYIWGSQDPNISQKGPLGAESVPKTLKFFNSTATSAILMKLTTIMYLLESLNRKTLRARKSFFWLNFQEYIQGLLSSQAC